MKTKSFIKVTVTKMSEEDSYEHGCIPSTCQDFGEIESFRVQSIDRVPAEIEERYGKPYIFDDRLEFQTTERGDGNTPSAADEREWKAGAFKLYAVNYSFYLTRVIEDRIENAQLKETFPELEEN
jgi:hypothetical protein